MQYDFMNITELSALEVLVGIAFASQRGILPQLPPMPDKGCLENTERSKHGIPEASLQSSSGVGQVFRWLAPSALNSLRITTWCRCEVVFILLPMSLPVPYVI